MTQHQFKGEFLEIKTRVAEGIDTQDIIALWESYDHLPLKELGIEFDTEHKIGLVEYYINEQVAFGMWAGDELVGGIMGYIAPMIFNPSIIMFHEVLWYVKPSHRMYSIQLLQDFEKYIGPQVDMIDMCNWATIDMKIAERMYRRLGYKLLEQRFVKETL